MFIQADIVQVRVVDHPLNHILWLTTSSLGLFAVFEPFLTIACTFF